MSKTSLEISKPLAPEDVRVGDYVAVSRLTLELLNLFFCSDPWKHEEPILGVRVTPRQAGYPLRVVRVCLPFVLVEDPHGRPATLDVRQHELARLSEEYGKKAFKCFQRQTGEAKASPLG